MPKLIEGTLATGGRVFDDPWNTIESVASLDVLAADASILVPLALWASDRATFEAWQGPVGLRLGGTDDPADIADDLPRFAAIAIEFPKFTDGRGYSIARLLRERFAYRGSLIAVGDVLRDQLFYMLRCGFDAFVLRHQDLVDDALTAFGDFSDGYQTSVERPVPWFKRHLAGVVA